MGEKTEARVTRVLLVVIGFTAIVGCDDTSPDEPIDAGIDGDISPDADHDRSDDADQRYVHGYSAGAHWIYGFGLYNSDFFADLGVCAGSLYAAVEDGIWPDATGEPMPIFIAHGTDDAIVPYSEALLARGEFENAGWPVRLWTSEGGTHAYEPAHQWEAWAFWSTDESGDAH